MLKKGQAVFAVYIILSFCMIVRVTAVSTEGKTVEKPKPTATATVAKETKKTKEKKQTKKKTTRKVVKSVVKQVLREEIPSVELKASQTRKMLADSIQRNCLYRIVEAEAGGQDMKGRIIVANVILNRVRHSHFPSTIKRVVFAHEGDCYQFSPIQDGRYKAVHIKKSTIEACNKALDGLDYSKGALYFMNRESASPRNVRWFDNRLKFLFKHGDHEFFTLKS